MKLGKISAINAPQAEPISLRCYTGNYRPALHVTYNDNANNGMVLTFSTETTQDQHQTLTFGSCAVWINGALYKICLFHDESLDQKKVDVIRQAGATIQKEKDCIVTVSSKDEFVTKVFYPYVYEARAKCVGFDLPYELTRLAASWGTARKMQDAFSIKLVEGIPRLPAIKIRSINSDAAFIQFATPLRTKSEKKQIPTHKVYRGYFLDLKTLGYAMSNKSFDGIEDAAKTFGVDTNLQNKKGITEDAIRNNVDKTLELHNIYCKIISVLRDTFLVKPNDSNKLYCPASIGKLYLEKLNIKPLLENNPEFPKEILGNLMSAYYGGRVETRIRKTPVPVTYLDCTSTYPTLFCLMGMYQFLAAEKIENYVTTKKTQKFLDGITLQDISKKETWTHLATTCKVVPDGSMIVPVRCSYGSKKTQNIGVNYLKSTDGTGLWYTVSDLIASKLLTGHIPTIEKAITFHPVGVQQNIPDEKIEIFKGVTVNPRKENFIERLIGKRIEMKQTSTEDGSEIDKTIQNTIKIIANTASYGIHIQVNSEKSEKENEPITVYGTDESFSVDQNTVSRKEIPARHFNPILGVFLPAAARLVLAAAESLVVQHRDGYVAYMDTDSVMVSPKYANEIQEFFQRLNPYGNKDVQIFKIEKSDDGKLLENVLFFGVSSKRYVLFEYDDTKNKFKIHKFTSHGFAHLLDVDEERWWHNILEMHYFPENKQEILGKYDSKYAVSKMSITTPNVLKRFSKLRPFNKILVGVGCKSDESGNVIIPTLPYLDAKKRGCIQYMGFTNYTTGKEYSDASLYWKPLSEMLEDYSNHKEAKSGGNVGLLPRLRMKIDRNLIKYVGKEVANLDAANVLGVSEDSEGCAVYDNFKEKILKIRPRDSHRFGISRSNLIAIQKKIRSNESQIKLQKGTIERLQKAFSDVVSGNFRNDGETMIEQGVIMK